MQSQQKQQQGDCPAMTPVLDPDQCLALISTLPEPYRTMVLVAICTGLRTSEILALRWSRIDFDRLTLKVTVKAVNGRIGRLKAECSEATLPLDRDFAAALQQWKSRCRPTAGDGSSPAPSRTGVSTPAPFRRTTSVLRRGNSASRESDGTRSATLTERGSIPSARRSASNKS